MDTRSDPAMATSVSRVSHGSEADREARSPERGNGPLPWTGPQTQLLGQTPEKSAISEPSAKHAIKPVRSVPRSSELASRSTDSDRFLSTGEKFGLTSGAAAPSKLSVKVVFMGEIQRWAGRRELEMELPLESTVQALAQKLFRSCGAEFCQHALTKEGAFQPHVAVFVNGVQIGRLDGMKTVLTGGQVRLMLLPMYEGG